MCWIFPKTISHNQISIILIQIQKKFLNIKKLES